MSLRKIAVLVLVHQDPDMLRELVLDLQHADIDIFVHVDKRAAQPPFEDACAGLNVSFVEHRVPVFWGGFGMVEATLQLMEAAAARGPYRYYSLQSGVDFPILGASALVERLAEAKDEFITSERMPLPHKPMKRFSRYWIEGGMRNGLLRRILVEGANAVLSLFPRGNHRLLENKPLWAGSSWWTLSGDCVAYILTSVAQDSRWVQAFRSTRSPDEMFFQTLVMNSPYAARVVDNLMFDDWLATTGPLPAMIDLHHEAKLRGSRFLWARKFSSKSPQVIEAVRQWRFQGER